MPKVTVLMSVYNGERRLREAIESILGQTFRDIEFLIIDDASTDRSREIVLSCGDPRIRLLLNEANLGLTKSLNKGLKLAAGDYVARMDADDVSLPERLEKQVAYLDEHPEDALVASRYEIIDEDGRTELISAAAPSREEFYYRLVFQNMMTHSSVMFRRRVVESLGWYDESFERSQDYDLWHRISRAHGIGMIDQALVKWRRRRDSISERQGDAQRECARRIFMKHVREIVPDASAAELASLARLHEGGAVRLTPTDIGALRRLNKAVNDRRPAFLDKRRLARAEVKTMLIYFVKARSLKYSFFRSLNDRRKKLAGWIRGGWNDRRRSS